MQKQTMPRQTIGILAGMGPHSTAPFIDLVVAECQRQYGAKDDIDFPKMMIYSLPTPFYTDRALDPAAMETALSSGLQDLERFGVGFVAMACNTVHIYYPQLANSTSVPLLNMVELTLEALPSGQQKVVVIASRPTMESKIYQNGLRLRGHEIVELDWQRQIDGLIEATRTNQEPSFFEKSWSELTARARQAGADTIIVACTDLSSMSCGPVDGIHVLDASRCLAQGIVKRWLISSEAAAASMIWRQGNFLLTTDKERLQLQQVHHFLSRQAYWSLGIPYDIVSAATRNSLCFSLFDESKADLPQIGLARVVTDHATFAWLCDVYVEPTYRGKGLAKWMMACVMEHPAMKGLRRICLTTKDAHTLYARYGFEVTPTPGNWMEIKDNDLYKKIKATASIDGGSHED